jgi:hypothetical protein
MNTIANTTAMQNGSQIRSKRVTTSDPRRADGP